MARFKDNIPPAKDNKTACYDHTSDPWFKQRYDTEVSMVVKAYLVPLYLKRDGFRPSKAEHYGDGGAFPEIHYVQYPLGMFRKEGVAFGHKTLPVMLDEHGRVTFDAIVRQSENASKIVYSDYRDLVPKILKDEERVEEEMDIDGKKEIEEKTTLDTKMALEKIVNVRLSAAQPNNVSTASLGTKYINYKPSQQSSAFNSGAKERRVMMVDVQVDPMEPPNLKHKRVPKGNSSPPVPVMHSPPRPVTAEDQKDWKIPPCVSNWKNPKGFTIPLDKRLAADGRALQEVQINDNFAKFSEALYLSEQKAREAVDMRIKVQKEMMLREKEKKELELISVAQKARSEKTCAAPAAASMPSDKNMLDFNDIRGDSERQLEKDAPRETKGEREDRLRREKIFKKRHRERERERRLEAKDVAMGKKSKITRDRDRDISEKVALGMASAGGGRGGEVLYDTRLFNQEKGMDSGFATEDQYNVYDKRLFTAQITLQTLCRPKKDEDFDTYGGADEQLDKITKTSRFKPDKSFTGTSEETGPRDRPVEFEKELEEDPFGLDEFLDEVKKGRKALDKIGGSGTMNASAGSLMQDDNEVGSGSGRNKINFEKQKKR
ncbi:SNW/SKI-interacting protein-like [Heracleum sosnowskyi]|uniref:SNW/SKI-interacting protein-like n=1 Tax=Heracleum sosnowskyi TaxID=360622 RepID=A0AAD8HFS8_9APIA|nr:SNW/SKI-interacting protein-like [Heracleum sosnowskyi]